MRHLFLPLVAAVVVGCAQPATTSSTAAEARPEAEPVVAACVLPVYDLAHLQPPASRRLDSVQVVRLYAQDAGLRDVLEHYYPEEHVYALDTVRCAGFVLLPVYHVDESGHHDLYYITLDPAVQRVRQVKLVAAWGSDGGWWGKTTMQRRGGRLRVRKVDEIVDETSHDEYTTRTTDSLMVDYYLSPAGQLVQTRIDSSRRIAHTNTK
jgi:hypothetical protein